MILAQKYGILCNINNIKLIRVKNRLGAIIKNVFKFLVQNTMCGITPI